MKVIYLPHAFQKQNCSCTFASSYEAICGVVSPPDCFARIRSISFLSPPLSDRFLISSEVIVLLRLQCGRKQRNDLHARWQNRKQHVYRGLSKLTV